MTDYTPKPRIKGHIIPPKDTRLPVLCIQEEEEIRRGEQEGERAEGEGTGGDCGILNARATTHKPNGTGWNAGPTVCFNGTDKAGCWPKSPAD